MANLVMLNNFLHDFSAAGWLVCAVVLTTVLREASTRGDQTKQLFLPVLRAVLKMFNLAVIGTFLFGAGRTLAYRQYEWNAAAGDSQLVLLGLKHIGFTVLVAFTIRPYLRALKIVKEST